MRILAVCIVACMPVVASGTTIISLTSGGQSSLTASRELTSLPLDVSLTLDERVASGCFAFFGALACSPPSSHLFIADRTRYPAIQGWTSWDEMLPPLLIGSSLSQRIDFGYIELGGNYELFLAPGTTTVQALTVGGFQSLPNGVYTFTVVDSTASDLIDNRGAWCDDTGYAHSFDIVEEFTLTLVPEPSTLSLLILGGFILRRRVGSS